MVRHTSLLGETLDDLLGLDDRLAATLVHSRRAHRYAVALARAVDPRLLDDENVGQGFALHDVGKIGIPESILLKPAALTAAEKKLMHTHAVLGERILSAATTLRDTGLNIVRSHHERWDGRGYPDGLGGSAIPLAARICAVADSLDAMTSHRPYRRARSWSAAVREITHKAGSQFDPHIVGAFTEIEPTVRAIRAQLSGRGPKDEGPLSGPRRSTLPFSQLR